MIANTLTAQAYIKRYLAMLWFKNIKESKDTLENHIGSINEAIQKFNANANLFAGKFPNREVSQHLSHLTNFEQHELVQGGNLPQLQDRFNEYNRLIAENKKV